MKIPRTESADGLKAFWAVFFALLFLTFASAVYCTDPTNRLDFDGDGKADIAIYREGNASRVSQVYSQSAFLYRSSLSGIWVNIPWGQTLDVPIPADYVGEDNKTDPTVFRWFDPYAPPFDGNTIYTLGGGLPAFGNQYGRKMGRNFIPDDGDQKAELGEFRHINIYADSDTEDIFYQYVFYYQLGATGLDYVVTNVPNGQSALSYNQVPVPEDYRDGDGKSEIAVFNTNTGCYHVWVNKLPINDPPLNAPSPPCFGSGYTPAPGDYDRDGWIDYAVFKALDGSNFEWKFVSSQSGGTPTTYLLTTTWSGLGKPVAADYDGDGKTDYAVAQYSDAPPNNNNSWNWTIRKSGCPANRVLACSPSIVTETYGLRSDTQLASPYFNDPWY